MPDAPQAQANRAQIAPAYIPPESLAGAFSQGQVRAHRSRPLRIFPSTLNLWKRLYRDEGLQMPKYEGLEEYVFHTFERMYKAFDRDRHLMAPGQLCEVRYEDLISRPLEQMRRIYQELELGDFDAVRPAIETYMAAQKDYKTNRYQLSPENRAEIGRRWEKYLLKYGYQPAAPIKVSEKSVAQTTS